MSGKRKTLVQGAAALVLAATAATSAYAQGVIRTNRLSAALAAELAAATVEACVKLDQQVTVVVLDTSGVHQAMIRGDGAGIHTIDGAHYKAFTAMTFKTDTINIVERAAKGRVSSSFARVPNLLLAQGGVVVKVGDEVIAAIGVSGARGNNMDTQCARAALDRIKDRLH